MNEDGLQEIMRMQREMDRLLARLWKEGPGRRLLAASPAAGLLPAQAGHARPLADVWETGQEVKAEVDLPGVDKKAIQVTVTPHSVHITAEKAVKKETRKKGHHVLERAYTGFSRSFSLPAEVLPEKAKAVYRDGVLHLSLPKAKKAGTPAKRVRVQ